MTRILRAPAIAALVSGLCGLVQAQQGSRVSIEADQVLVIDGRKVFPIGFTMPPPPEAEAPSGKSGIEELRAASATFRPFLLNSRASEALSPLPAPTIRAVR